MRKAPPEGRGDTVLSQPVGFRLFSQARTLEDRGELDRALELYRSASRCVAFAPDSLQAAARIEREQGLLQEAITSLTHALHHCQDDRLLCFELYMEIGDIHAQLGDFEEATYFYRRAERYDREDVSLQRRLRSASQLAQSQQISIDIEEMAPEWESSETWSLEDWELATGT